jgi:hypothetical protein
LAKLEAELAEEDIWYSSLEGVYEDIIILEEQIALLSPRSPQHRAEGETPMDDALE